MNTYELLWIVTFIVLIILSNLIFINACSLIATLKIKNMPNCDIHNSYMKIAEEISNRSYAVRLKVGALIVKDNTIISDGYNGMPYGFDNSCEIDNITNIEVLHAESNAIAKIAKSTQSSLDSTLYVTISPCIECAKLIIQCGIKNIYFNVRYRNLDGIDLLLKAKINVFEKDEKRNIFSKYIRGNLNN